MPVAYYPLDQVIVFGAVLAAAGAFLMAFAPNLPILFAAVVLSYVGAALVNVPGIFFGQPLVS